LKNFVIILILLMPFANLFSQLADEKLSSMELHLNTVIESTASGKTVLEKYFADSKSQVLESLINDQVKQVVFSRLKDVAINIPIIVQDEKPDSSPIRDNSYKVNVRIIIDDEVSFTINVSIVKIATSSEVFRASGRKALKVDVLDRVDKWITLSESGNEDPEVNQILRQIASHLTARIDNAVVRWIIESTVKVRVAIGTFEKIGGDEEYKYLERQIKKMVEAEFSNSEAILVYPLEEASVGINRSEITPLLNYRIEGSFIEIDNELRIDIRCIKLPNQRILASRDIIVDTVDVKKLSRGVAEISSALKRIMESDFRRSTKTLAVVARKPEKLFSFGEPDEEDILIAKEISRAITQKLRLLTLESDEDQAILSLQILEDLDKVDEYIKIKTSPSEILADLDVDYLVVTSYKNLGREIRLSSNLYSYDVERPAVAKFILEEKAKKIYINDVVNKTVFSILESLCHLGFVSVSSKCEEISLEKENTRYADKIGEIGIPDLRRSKEVGFRVGASIHSIEQPESDPVDIYLNKGSSRYIEGYFSQVLPNTRIRGLDLGFGASIGIDIIKRIGLNRGVIYANGFINLKAIYSGLQYSQLPLIFGIGSGVGGQGISYKFSKGEQYYEDFQEDNGDIELAFNSFAEVEFPVSEQYRFHGMLRYVYPSDIELKFDNGLLNNSEDKIQKGRIGGYYFVIGLKYTWR